MAISWREHCRIAAEERLDPRRDFSEVRRRAALRAVANRPQRRPPVMIPPPVTVTAPIRRQLLLPGIFRTQHRL